MAYLSYFIIAMGLIGSLISPTQALTCSSQKFKTKTFSNCDDLTHLNAFLHWTYNSSNSSLSIAFQASPAKPDGWVAWAINPTGTGMAGSQALIAFLANGAPTVKTLKISNYSSVIPSKLSFDVWDLTADHSDGKIRIFATVKVPENVKSVNQIWQVGSVVNVTTGAPAVHEFKPANLMAKGVLELVQTSAVSGPSAAPEPSAGTGTGTGTAAPSPDKSEGSNIRSRNLGFFVGLFLFIWGVFVF